MIGMVETKVERNGKIEREGRYYLSSAKLATTFANAARIRRHLCSTSPFIMTLPGSEPATNLVPDQKGQT
ncbi:hypothetical protein NKI86_29105 [Mesorhizobium sp. M0320]|uniref:hypothetical protein n=1 Tax=Mesorhizobium sp. M0320 TaxID=2956936 RepID=UPI00333B9498